MKVETVVAVLAREIALAETAQAYETACARAAGAEYSALRSRGERGTSAWGVAKDLHELLVGVTSRRCDQLHALRGFAQRLARRPVAPAAGELRGAVVAARAWRAAMARTYGEYAVRLAHGLARVEREAAARAAAGPARTTAPQRRALACLQRRGATRRHGWVLWQYTDGAVTRAMLTRLEALGMVEVSRPVECDARVTDAGRAELAGHPADEAPAGEVRS